MASTGLTVLFTQPYENSIMLISKSSFLLFILALLLILNGCAAKVENGQRMYTWSNWQTGKSNIFPPHLF